jgi:hypothetical protein
MVESTSRIVSATGPNKTQRVVTLDRGWCDGAGVVGGTKVRILYDRVAVIVPPDLAEDADRILRVLNSRSRRGEFERLRGLLAPRFQAAPLPGEVLP